MSLIMYQSREEFKRKILLSIILTIFDSTTEMIIVAEIRWLLNFSCSLLFGEIFHQKFEYKYSFKKSKEISFEKFLTEKFYKVMKILINLVFIKKIMDFYKNSN